MSVDFRSDTVPHRGIILLFVFFELSESRASFFDDMLCIFKMIFIFLHAVEFSLRLAF